MPIDLEQWQWETQYRQIRKEHIHICTFILNLQWLYNPDISTSSVVPTLLEAPLPAYLAIHDFMNLKIMFWQSNQLVSEDQCLF